MTESSVTQTRNDFESAKKEYDFWTTGGNCQPGSTKWEEVVAKYSAARDAYDFALRQREQAEPEPQEVAVSTQSSKRVFVVHGRDLRLRDGAFAFLRTLGLEPLEWTKAIQLTGKASPYIGEILDAAFGYAQAVVVLLTPDDEARLRHDLVEPHDPQHEKELTGQARPNVLFEAGMAFASHADRTVLVQFGNLRPFSDIAGRHAVRMDNSAQKRHELAIKLRTAGCLIDQDGTDWQTAGDLSPPVTTTASQVPAQDRASSSHLKLDPQISMLAQFKRVVIAPVSRTTSQQEFTLDSVDELGVLIRLPGGTGVRLPCGDYVESWDDTSMKPKILLTRKYFQGYFPGHEHAKEYFLPR
jgi:predicted nucleotide-binding protein